MKNITNTLFVCSAFAGFSFTTAQAATAIYEQDFSVAPTTTVVAPTGVLGTNFAFEVLAWAGTGASPNLDVSDGKAAFTGNSSINADTQASLAIFIDTSGLSTGNYNWSFDILDYVAGGGGFATSYSLYEGNGAVSVRLGAANAPTTVYPIEDPLGAPTFDQIGTGTAFTGNGSHSIAFTLTEAGSAGDYLALTWFLGETANQSGQNSVNFSIDNILVTAVPEPGTYALIGGLLALSYVMVRRRR